MKKSSGILVRSFNSIINTTLGDSQISQVGERSIEDKSELSKLCSVVRKMMDSKSGVLKDDEEVANYSFQDLREWVEKNECCNELSATSILYDMVDNDFLECSNKEEEQSKQLFSFTEKAVQQLSSKEMKRYFVRKNTKPTSWGRRSERAVTLMEQGAKKDDLRKSRTTAPAEVKKKLFEILSAPSKEEVKAEKPKKIEYDVRPIEQKHVPASVELLVKSFKRSKRFEYALSDQPDDICEKFLTKVFTSNMTWTVKVHKWSAFAINSKFISLRPRFFSKALGELLREKVWWVWWSLFLQTQGKTSPSSKYSN